MNVTLSLCMIVKNEEKALPNCLESVKNLFDEIIIVDTGSSDKTIEIAKRYTDKIYSFEWIDDFSAARNFSFSKSGCDYIMWLDADDVLLEEDAKKLTALKQELDLSVPQVAAKYRVGFDENGCVTLEYYRERIFLKSAGFKWSGRIHETIPIVTNCRYADFAVTHHKMRPTERGRNLRIFEKMIAEGYAMEARDCYYFARELYYNGRIDEAIVEFERFLLREDAFIENKIDACRLLGECCAAAGKNPLPALFKSFEFAPPRAEICCELGKYFLKSGKRGDAAYWYCEALRKKPDLNSGAFVLRDCYDFIPLLQLCVIAYAEGNVKEAQRYNEKAAAIKPNDKAVLFNKEFFQKLK